ncbi:MAG: helix-turn-helix transcriptional regulator [Tissierellaceae bacterium]|nr:helix-turn-helix transcriptional regulator [Tissierellaceae bacterium]
MQLNERQERIIEIVKENQPITGEAIADELKLSRSTIRPDLSILTMSGILDARPRVGYFFTGKTGLNLLSDRIGSIFVDEIKSIPVVVDESTSIYDAIVAMFLDNVGSIFISDQGILSGVISRKDIIRTAIGGTDLHHVPVGVIMTRMPNLVYVRSKDTILSAAEKLIEHEIDSLPVVDVIDEDKKQYKVVGRITKTTITRLFVELGKNS